MLCCVCNTMQNGCIFDCLDAIKGVMPWHRSLFFGVGFVVLSFDQFADSCYGSACSLKIAAANGKGKAFLQYDGFR